MFLNLNHHQLDIYKISRMFVVECYKVTKLFPGEERYCMIAQVRRAALSVYFNINEGCSRTSLAERKRFFEISRGSLIEIDSAFDIAGDLQYTTKEELSVVGLYLIRCFSMLSKMIGSNNLKNY